MYPVMMTSLILVLNSFRRSRSGTAQACCTLRVSSNSRVKALSLSFGEILAEDGVEVPVDIFVFVDSVVIRFAIIVQLRKGSIIINKQYQI